MPGERSENESNNLAACVPQESWSWPTLSGTANAWRNREHVVLDLFSNLKFVTGYFWWTSGSRDNPTWPNIGNLSCVVCSGVLCVVVCVRCRGAGNGQEVCKRFNDSRRLGQKCVFQKRRDSVAPKDLRQQGPHLPRPQMPPKVSRRVWPPQVVHARACRRRHPPNHRLLQNAPPYQAPAFQGLRTLLGWLLRVELAVSLWLWMSAQWATRRSFSNSRKDVNANASGLRSDCMNMCQLTPWAHTLHVKSAAEMWLMSFAFRARTLYPRCVRLRPHFFAPIESVGVRVRLLHLATWK